MTETKDTKVKVAVIGAGPSGLTTLKNLREEGFDAVAFEKHEGVGGVWRFNPDPNVTSVLKNTLANTSKFTFTYTDFPPPEEYPPFMTPTQIVEYVTAYATHFKLFEHIEFDTAVQKIERNKEDTLWLVHTAKKGADPQIREFDKVVICTGDYNKPFLPPEFEGREVFKGRVIHSQAYKGPEDFEGKNVVIVGLGNTACDIAVDLIGTANKIYVSHRSGIQLVPRQVQSKPIDYHLTRRLDVIKNLVDSIAPKLALTVGTSIFKSYTTSTWGKLDPEWHIHPPPHIRTHQPTVNDDIVPALRDKKITSVAGLQAFTGPDTVKLSDETELSSVDAVILCTGYQADFSLVGPDLDPTLIPSSPINSHLQPLITSGPIPSLYKNIFHPAYPTSLAYTCNWAFVSAGLPIMDLMSMAISQVWQPSIAKSLSPSFPPSPSQINAEIMQHRQWVLDLATTGTGGVYGNIVNDRTWMAWLHYVAGTGVNENLGLGWRGWWFWVRRPGLAGSLWGGVNSPAGWRLFEGPGGRRKSWSGAEEEIWRVNGEVRRWCTREVNVKKGGD